MIVSQNQAAAVIERGNWRVVLCGECALCVRALDRIREMTAPR